MSWSQIRRFIVGYSWVSRFVVASTIVVKSIKRTDRLGTKEAKDSAALL